MSPFFGLGAERGGELIRGTLRYIQSSKNKVHDAMQFTKWTNRYLCTQEYLCGKPQNLYKLSVEIKGYLTKNGPSCHST